MVKSKEVCSRFSHFQVRSDKNRQDTSLALVIYLRSVSVLSQGKYLEEMSCRSCRPTITSFDLDDHLGPSIDGWTTST
jgi:hypothetical protein